MAPVTVYFAADASGLEQVTAQAANVVRQKTEQVTASFQASAEKTAAYADRLAAISAQAAQGANAVGQAAAGVGAAAGDAAKSLQAMGQEDLAAKVAVLEARIAALTAQAEKAAAGAAKVSGAFAQGSTTLAAYGQGLGQVTTAAEPIVAAAEETVVASQRVGGALSGVSDFARKTSQGLTMVSDSLDTVSTAAGGAAIVLDVLGRGKGAKLSETLTSVSGRIQELNAAITTTASITGMAADGLDAVDSATSKAASAVSDATKEIQQAAEAQTQLAAAAAPEQIAAVSAEAAAGQQALTEATEAYGQQLDAVNASSGQMVQSTRELAEQQRELSQEAEAAEGGYLGLGIAIAAIGAAIYGVYAAWEGLVGLAEDAGTATGDVIYDTVDAIADYTSAVTGYARVQQMMTEETRATFTALQDLGRELGVQTQHLVSLDDVAKDFKVSQEQAETGMRRMVELIEDQSDATKEARAILQDYGVNLRGLTANDWAKALDEFARAMNNTRDSTQKTKDIIAVLGNDGPRWLRGIADGAGDISHAATEADRIVQASQARITASQAKIEKGPQEATTWWGGVVERWDRMTTLSDKFKAQQEYALLDMSLAWDEYRSDVASLGDVWDGLTESVYKYTQAVSGSLVVPDPPPDPRAEGPSAHMREIYANPVKDTSLEGYQQDLDELKAKKENWLTWSLERERQFWADARKEWVAAQETSTAWSIDNSPVKKGLDEKVGDADRAIAERDNSVDVYRRELEEKKAASGQYYATSKQQELDYWTGRLATATAGTKLYQDIEKEIFTLRRGLEQDSYDLGQAELRAKADAARGNAAEQVAIAQQVADKTAQMYGQDSLRHKQALLDVERAKRAAAEETLNYDLAMLRAKQDAASGDAVAQLAIQRQIADRIAQLYGERSSQHKQALLDIERAERAHAEQMRRLVQVQSQAELQAINDNWSAQRDAISYQAQIGQLNAVEEVQRLRAVEQQKYALEQDNRRRALANIKSDVVARKQALLEIERAERQHAAVIRRLDRQQALARRDQIKTWTSPIADTTREMISGITNGTLTADQLVSSFLQGMVGKYVAHLGEMAMEWITQHVIMAAFSEAMAVDEVATQATTGIATMAATKMQAVTEISAAASTGAAWAMASAAAIPVVGWEMAPGVGAAHYAKAMGYMATLAVPAAEKGWWEVPQDTLAVIHQKEMVMPAHLAEGVRQMVDGGGAGAPASAAPSINFAPTVVGLDRHAIQTMLRREASLLSSLVSGQERKFQRRGY